MVGSSGPPPGELRRGAPGKGGGPRAAMLTLPSSVTLEGEELLELLFIMGADSGSEAEGFPDASGGHRGRGGGPSTDPKSLRGISLRLSVADRGLAGGSAVSGGEHSPPLTGDGPKEPFWLRGPLRGGFWVLGLPGIGFTITGSSCSIAIFWVSSNNLCLRLAASLRSSAIALSAARALSQLS